MINPKTPPHNLEAEQSVLGAILLEESNIARAEELLSPDDFTVPLMPEYLSVCWRCMMKDGQSIP